MPPQAFYHDKIITALLADEWTITDDPLFLTFDEENLYPDADQAREVIAAKKRSMGIVVINKSFLGASHLSDLEEAFGQYLLVRHLLEYNDDDRHVYLAIPERTYKGIFTDKIGRLVIAKSRLQLIVFDEHQERIVKWVS